MDKKKVIDKIKKLYALGTSPEKEEAELALAKAHELLVRYNLSMQDIESSDKEFVKEIAFEGKTNRPSWQRDLFLIICRYFMVHPMVVIRRGYGNGNNNRGYVIVGDKVNVTLVNYTISYLLSTYKSLADKFMKGYKKEKMGEIKKIDSIPHELLNDELLNIQKRHSIGSMVKIRNSFYHGLNDGISTALQKQVVIEQREKGLMVVEDPDLKKHIESIIDGKSKSKSNSDINAGAYMHGVAEGGNIQIRNGIETTTTESGKYLR